MREELTASTSPRNRHGRSKAIASSAQGKRAPQLPPLAHLRPATSLCLPRRLSSRPPPQPNSQGLISGVPHPFFSFQGMVSMWSVNVCPNLRSLAGGIVLGFLVSSMVTAEAWG